MESVYRFSEEFFKRKKSFFMILRIVIPIFILLLFGSSLLQKNDSWEIIGSVIGSVITIVIFELISISVPWAIFKRFRKTTVIVRPGQLEKRIGDYSESLTLNNETTIKRTESKKGEILQLIIKNKRNSMVLAGFEKMDDLLSEISRQIGNPAMLSARTSLIDESTGAGQFKSIMLGIGLYLAVMAVCIVLIIAGMNYFHSDISKELDSIISIGIGLFFIIFNPLSKALGKNFRKYEIIGGIIFVLLCLARLFSR